MNTMVIIGKVQTLPEAYETPTGVKLAKLVLDVERNFRSNDGNYEHDLYQVILWRGIADTVLDLCEVGNLVAVKGRLNATNYVNKDEKLIYAVELVAEKISFLTTSKKD